MKHVGMTVTTPDDIWDIGIFLTFRTPISATVILNDPYFRFYYLDFPTDKLFTDVFKLSATYLTDALAFINIEILFLRFDACKLICCL